MDGMHYHPRRWVLLLCMRVCLFVPFARMNPLVIWKRMGSDLCFLVIGIRRQGNIAGFGNPSNDDEDQQRFWNGNSTQFGGDDKK